MRSVDRIAALILVIAAVTILVLAILVILDVRLETELNREVIGGLQAQDGLESLRSRLHDLKYAAREVALTGNAEAGVAIERRSIEAEADLAYLQERSRTDLHLAETMAPLTAHVKPFIMQGVPRGRARPPWRARRARQTRSAKRSRRVRGRRSSARSKRRRGASTIAPCSRSASARAWTAT